jgi:sortase A
MEALLATALIVIVVAGLGVYGPVARGRVPASAEPAALTPVPQPSGGNDPISKLVDLLRRRRGARLVVSTLSIGLLVGAVGMIGYPFYTNLVTDRIQSQLDRQLASPDLRDAYLNREIAEGDSLTRIIIPAIGVDTVVVSGITASALRAGAGHYPQSPLPCEIGNVAIAGHRTTYGRPFHDLDLLSPGDQIILRTPIGSCTYEVTREPWIVAPTAVEVVANTPNEAALTLTTCHPKGSARERLIVRATMVSSEVRS